MVDPRDAPDDGPARDATAAWVGAGLLLGLVGGVLAGLLRAPRSADGVRPAAEARG